jgi:hypothetical protein
LHIFSYFLERTLKKAYKILDEPMISQVQLEKRIEFARDWRKEHVDKYGKLLLMFSDEKICTVNGGLNM